VLSRFNANLIWSCMILRVTSHNVLAFSLIGIGVLVFVFARQISTLNLRRGPGSISGILGQQKRIRCRFMPGQSEVSVWVRSCGA
jgi:hypothetical protein